MSTVAYREMESALLLIPDPGRRQELLILLDEQQASDTRFAEKHPREPRRG